MKLAAHVQEREIEVITLNFSCMRASSAKPRTGCDTDNWALGALFGF